MTRSAARRATVLMYHAVAPESGHIAGADPHYAVSRAALMRHLDFASASGLALTSVARRLADWTNARRCVALTFDDGHASNALAAEIVAGKGGCADFFINSSTVGACHMLSWAELRSMSAAGMSIQSHGDTHRYFDQLNPNEMRDELVRSKQAIEDKIGQPVVLFAPPGGRMRHGLSALAKHLGYSAVCSSRAGIWRLDTAAEIPRLAVLCTTSDRQLIGWVEQQPIGLAKARLRHAVLAGAKHVLGNARYEQLRDRLRSRAGQARTEPHD